MALARLPNLIQLCLKVDFESAEVTVPQWIPISISKPFPNLVELTLGCHRTDGLITLFEELRGERLE